eukprot:gene26148-biopygen14412
MWFAYFPFVIFGLVFVLVLLESTLDRGEDPFHRSELISHCSPSVASTLPHDNRWTYISCRSAHRVREVTVKAPCIPCKRVRGRRGCRKIELLVVVGGSGSGDGGDGDNSHHSGALVPSGWPNP